MPLIELFNGEREEPAHNNKNTSPEVERRLKASKDEESRGSVQPVSPETQIISFCFLLFAQIS